MKTSLFVRPSERVPLGRELGRFGDVCMGGGLPSPEVRMLVDYTGVRSFRRCTGVSPGVFVARRGDEGRESQDRTVSGTRTLVADSLSGSSAGTVVWWSGRFVGSRVKVPGHPIGTTCVGSDQFVGTSDEGHTCGESVDLSERGQSLDSLSGYSGIVFAGVRSTRRNTGVESGLLVGVTVGSIVSWSGRLVGTWT